MSGDFQVFVSVLAPLYVLVIILFLFSLFRHFYRRHISQILQYEYGTDHGSQRGPFSFVTYLREKLDPTCFGDRLDMLLFGHITNSCITSINVGWQFRETRFRHDYPLDYTDQEGVKYAVVGALLFNKQHFNVAGECLLCMFEFLSPDGDLLGYGYLCIVFVF